MNVVNVVQGSAEWHALRVKHFTASEAPAMLGLSKYKTRAALLREKATGLVPEVDEATQARFNKGHAVEASARPIVETLLGVELFPATATLEVEGLPLSASYDGVSMDEQTLWENKLLNSSNGANIVAAIENEHWPQLEQQALIAGTDMVYFTVSDGTEAGTQLDAYVSRPERRTQLLAGWKQFAEDLKNYQHVETAPVAVGRAPETLPALRIEVTGMVTASNLSEFKARALSVISEINTDLKTDEDFANAEKTVKWCGEVEEKLDAAKQHALSQTASIDDLFRAIDQIKSEARAKRLELDKLVKSRKEALRTEIVIRAQGDLQTHVDTLNKRLGKPYLPAQATVRFASAIKGLKTISSIRDAVGTELANAKIEASTAADHIEINLNTLRDLAKDHTFLFHDTAQIVLKQNDDLTALIKARIADHKAAEEQRLEHERERIRKEEQAKLVAVTPPTTEEPAKPVSVAPPIPAPASATVTPIAARSTDANTINAYMATFEAEPKKKEEIRNHLIAFTKFRNEAKAVA